MGVHNVAVPPLGEELAASAAGMTAQEQGELAVTELARTIAQISIIDIAVFFAVLLVGFAYVWKRGDLDWVRTLSRERAAQLARPPRHEAQEPALTP